MSSLQIFNSPKFGQVRSVIIDGKTYFVAIDIATALGYKNTRDAINRHCKGVVKHDGVTFNGGTPSLIPEGDIYRLAAKSELPGADLFERWIFDTVLPQIHHTGGYIPQDNTDTDADILAKALLIAQKTIENKDKLLTQAEFENKQKDQVIGELQPRADYTDNILKNTGLVTISQIAKDYGMSGNKMNEKLHGLGVQFKQSGQWLLYSKYHDKGYTHSETIPITRTDGRKDVKMNTKWTQKGRLFLYNLLKENGILPVIEQINERVS